MCCLSIWELSLHKYRLISWVCVCITDIVRKSECTKYKSIHGLAKNDKLRHHASTRSVANIFYHIERHTLSLLNIHVMQEKSSRLVGAIAHSFSCYIVIIKLVFLFFCTLRVMHDLWKNKKRSKVCKNFAIRNTCKRVICIYITLVLIFHLSNNSESEQKTSWAEFRTRIVTRKFSLLPKACKRRKSIPQFDRCYYMCVILTILVPIFVTGDIVRIVTDKVTILEFELRSIRLIFREDTR